jgi:hypothetical protein
MASHEAQLLANLKMEVAKKLNRLVILGVRGLELRTLAPAVQWRVFQKELGKIGNAIHSGAKSAPESIRRISNIHGESDV